MTTPGIGDTRTLPTTQINLFHKNPRRGDVEAIAGSLQAHGQFRPIVVNEGTHTGRPMETLAGNHTLKAIQLLAERNPKDPRWQHVEAYVIDVDEDQAARIVLADNRTSDLATYDESELLDLLESVDDDLDGTGYDYDDLNTLLAATSTTAADFADYFEAQAEEAQDASEDAPTAPPSDADASIDPGTTQGTPEGSEGPQEAGDGPEEIWLALTFSVTVEQRRRIRAVLTEIKNRENLPTSAATLVHALESYPGLDVDKVVADTEAELTQEVTGDGDTIPNKESDK